MKCYCVYVCVKVVPFGSNKLLDIVSCAVLALNRQEIASVLACRTFCDYSVCQSIICSRCICLCRNFTFSICVNAECRTAQSSAFYAVNLVDNDIRIRLVLEVDSCYSIGLDFNVFAVLGNITDCLSGLDLCNLVITDTEIAYSDCTLCVGSKGLVIALSGLGCAGNTELPARKNTVRTSLDNTYRTRHCLVSKHFLYRACRCDRECHRINAKAVTCCTAYFVHSVFFSCRKLICNKVICGFVQL